MLESIVIAVLIFVVVVWAIGLLPVPESPFPLKTLLYIVAAVVLIVYLLRWI